MQSKSAALVIVTGLVLAAAGCRNVLEDAAQEGTLRRAFTDASAASGVPVELLLAVGWVETRWQMPDAAGAAAQEHDEHHARNAVGLMGVVDRADEPRLASAAATLGLDAELARTDAATHVHVAAEALRAIAAHKGAMPTSVQGWSAALGVYGADGDEEAGAAYVRAVFDAIDRGAVGVASTGETLRLPGRGKRAGGPKVQALVADADSNSVDDYLTARSGHFHSGRSRSIDRIVIHTTEGSYAGAISWFRSASNPYDTSAHYVIRSSDGEITQMVQEEDTAYHCRDWNSRAIGIEHEAISAQASWFTDAMYAESAALVRDICTRRGIPMDRAHIVGHDEVPGNDHSDPGNHWDWDRYMALVVGGQSIAPPGAPQEDEEQPSAPSAPGDACGGLDYFGACEGDTLSWCDAGQLYVVDCASDSASCGWQDGVIGYNCLAAIPEAAPPAEEPEEPAEEPAEPIDASDPCMGVDFLGVCDGETLVWCQDDTLRVFDCAASGDVCGWQDDSIGNNCVEAPAPEEVEDPCGGIDYAGVCDGDTLVWCSDETLYSADCASADQVCGWQNDDIGNNCL